MGRPFYGSQHCPEPPPSYVNHNMQPPLPHYDIMGQSFLGGQRYQEPSPFYANRSMQPPLPHYDIIRPRRLAQRLRLKYTNGQCLSRQRKLLVDHFDFGGAADEVTSSRSDFHNVDPPDMTAIHSDDDDDDEDIETSLVSDDESSEDTPGKADTVQPGGKPSPELGTLMPVKKNLKEGHKDQHIVFPLSISTKFNPHISISTSNNPRSNPHLHHLKQQTSTFSNLSTSTMQTQALMGRGGYNRISPPVLGRGGYNRDIKPSGISRPSNPSSLVVRSARVASDDGRGGYN
ncbi:hypothetical protein KCU95_g4591, partial [Aureobasidium melanogenum]